MVSQKLKANLKATHFPGGVSTGFELDSPEGIYALPDPTRWHTFFDDFDDYDANRWVITTSEVGTGTATEAIQDEDGGVLKLTNAQGDDDNDFLQLAETTAGTAIETFKWESGKDMFFKARFKVSEATQSDFVMGLQVTDTSPLDTTNGIFFQKDDGDDNLDFHVEASNTASSLTDIHTMVNDTYVEVAFVYDSSKTEFSAWVDGTKVGTITSTANAPTTELTVSFGLQNGAAGTAESMSVDYILAAKDRF